MKCYVHSDVDAVATCASCGKAICQNCAVDVAGKVRCKECLAKVSEQPPKTVGPPTNPLAIASIAIAVLGLLGCACGGGGLIFGIPATIVGWLARKQIAESQQEQQGEQIATIGMVIGIIEIISSILILILRSSQWGLL